MAIALRQSTTASSAGTTGGTFSFSISEQPLSGSLLVIILGRTSSSIHAVTAAGAGVTWVNPGDESFQETGYDILYGYNASGSGGTTVTLTFGLSLNYAVALTFMEFTGVLSSSSPFKSQGYGHATSNSASLNLIGLSNLASTDLVVAGFVALTSPNAFSNVASAFTPVTPEVDVGTSLAELAAYSTAGASSPTASISGSVAWGLVAANFSIAPSANTDHVHNADCDVEVDGYLIHYADCFVIEPPNIQLSMQMQNEKSLSTQMQNVINLSLASGG